MLYKSSVLASILFEGVDIIVFSLFFSLKSLNLFIKRYSSGSSNLFESDGLVTFLFFNYLELDCLG